jgi:dihydrodipicolinate synthase/N-acetylneuraminate lyase
MEKSRGLNGIIPVLNTPLNQDGSIDAQSLKRLVEFLIAKGVGGFWALGTSSEDMNLSFKKRLQVARLVSEANAGRLPLILGASFYALEDILDFIKETKDMEIDAFHVMIYHNLLGLNRVRWLYHHLADLSPKPIWMYSSANYGRWLPPEFVSEVKNYPNIEGIKYSTSNTVHAAKVLTLADEGFQVITSVASTLLSCLSLGSKAHVTSIASCLPEILMEIYKLFQEGRKEEALAAQRRLNQFLGGLPKGLREDNFFQAAEEKYILSLRGICREFTTSYFRDIHEEEKKLVKALVLENGLLAQKDIRSW